MILIKSNNSEIINYIVKIAKILIEYHDVHDTF